MIPLFPTGIDVSIGRLDFGDFMFLGNGPEDTLVSIGIERKSLKDLLNSMTTGRLSGHQIPGMVQQYNYCYILVEGIWRFNPMSGTLETLNGPVWEDVCLGQRRFMAKEVIGFLNTLAIKVGVHVVFSDNRKESIQVVCALYHWWNTKQWDEHSSHLSPNKAHKGPAGEINLIKPSLVRRVAAEIKGIGWGKSRAVDGHFASVEEMVNASEREWRNIPGIGKGIARDAYEEIRKRKEEITSEGDSGEEDTA